MSEPQKLQKYLCLTFGPYETISALSTDVNQIINSKFINNYTPVGGLSIASTNYYKYSNVRYTAAQTMMLKTESSPVKTESSPAAMTDVEEFKAMNDGSSTSNKKVLYDNVGGPDGGKRTRKHRQNKHRQNKHRQNNKTRKY